MIDAKNLKGDIMNRYSMLYPSYPKTIDNDNDIYDGDIMNHYAMKQKGMEFCPNCSNAWDMNECIECGYKKYKDITREEKDMN